MEESILSDVEGEEESVMHSTPHIRRRRIVATPQRVKFGKGDQNHSSNLYDDNDEDEDGDCEDVIGEGSEDEPVDNNHNNHNNSSFLSGSRIMDRLKFAEVQALLSTDLSRMPDVRALIGNNMMKLDSLHETVLHNAHEASHAVLKRIANLPAVESVLSDYLLREDEQWANYLSPKLEAGTKFIDAFYQGLHGKFSNWSMPVVITNRLKSLPSVRLSITEYFFEMERSGVDMLSGIVSKNIQRMKDLQSLVFKHVDSLPILQKLRQAHYEGVPELKTIEYVPKWMSDNEFILGGYRPVLLSFTRCIHSLSYVHNETGNIFTHLLGGIIFILYAIYVISYRVQTSVEDKALFGVFWTTAVACLICSAVFHTFYCHSYEWHVKFAKLDYFGIVLLISGSTLAVLYFTFHCDTELMKLYMGFTSVCGAIAAWGTASRWFEGPGKKHIRVFFFVALAATAVFPMLHFNFMYGTEHFLAVVDEVFLLYISAPLYLIGSFVFVMKIPERFFPGKLDIWFHSHQLWHIFVIAAAYAHYVGVYNMMHYRQENMCEYENSLGGVLIDN
eukprot:m.164498 g.164498  ORF g.164498 m.164498 type:complete len:559 (-) comp13425_c0_seq1:2969-4645(-)